MSADVEISIQCKSVSNKMTEVKIIRTNLCNLDEAVNIAKTEAIEQFFWEFPDNDLWESVDIKITAIRS